MIREVESVRPDFIIYVLMGESWDTRKGADTRIFDWTDSYLKKYYALVGIADGGNHDVYRWGADSIYYRPRRPGVTAVYRRLD